MRYGLESAGENAGGDRTGFPVQSSVLDELALLSRVVSGYSIPPVEACRFLTRGDADIYRVTTKGARFYLKIYRPPDTLAHAEAEGQLVTDLAAGGAPVVRAIPRTVGGYACEVQAVEGPRPILLFEEAPSTQVSELGEQVCEALGRAIAGLHEALDALKGDYALPAADTDRLLDERLPYARDFLPAADYAYLEAIGERLRVHVAAWPRERPAYGLCHADLVLSNVRLAADGGITFYDFGDACYIWRSFELAVIRLSIGRRAPERFGQLWDALLSGYSAVRALPAEFDAQLPWMLIRRQLGFISGNAASLPLRLGTQPFESDIFDWALSSIRNAAAELGL